MNWKYAATKLLPPIVFDAVRGLRRTSKTDEGVRPSFAKGKASPGTGTTVDRDRHRQHSYSQCGEDMIVEYVFRLRGVHQPSYLDLGAHHPFYLSNTAFFYEKGCRGINVEANPDLLAEFITYRPEDTNLNVGVSANDGEMDFYIMRDATLSTFSVEERDSMMAQGKEYSHTHTVKLRTISFILDTYFQGKFPDFLSIDVEGMDFEILQTIDFAHDAPRVICVEAAEYSPTGRGTRRTELIEFLKARGYFEYANTNLNAVMVKNSFWFP